MKVGFVHNGKLIKKIRIDNGTSLQLMIGRSSNCNIVLPYAVISSQHAQLLFDGSSLYIIDLGSTNGTFLDGQRIVVGQPVLIQAGNAVILAKSNGIQIVFNPDDYEPGPLPSSSDSEPQDTKVSTSLLEKLNRQPSIVIGRSKECDIVLEHPTISRKHAVIEKKGTDKYLVRDLGSTNGTFLNGKKVANAYFTPEDVLLMGRFRISLRGAARDLSKEIAVRTERITKRFNNNKIGLHESTLEIPSRAMLAIMGPSGCGKSTLLKALNGDSPASTGRVYICGLELNENYDYLKTQIGYVPQDDIVHRELTVEQSLKYAAKLRLTHASDETISQKINKVLRDLNIEHIRQNTIAKISGGQRKRVSIAVELLTDPLILFLDEPTSPLDPQTIEEFLKSLRNLSEQGTTVVMVTHKPEDLHYMDSVIFMAEGGHFAYYGDTRQYLNYFGVSDTIKVYTNLADKKAQKWIDRYKTENGNKGNTNSQPLPIKSTAKVNYFSQYYWLTRRYFNIKLNDRLNSLIMVGQAPIIAALICLIFDEVSQAVPFLLTISAVWFGVNNAAREIVSELPIYKRERMFNQGIIPYLLSKITVLCTFATLQCILFTFMITVRFNGEDPSWNAPFYTFCWMLFISFISALMGLFLSAIMNTVEKVMTFVPIVLIPQIMLAGLIAKITNKLVEFLSYFTISRWGTEGFSAIQEKVRITIPSVGVPPNQDPTQMPESPPPDPDVQSGATSQVVNAVENLKESFHSTMYEDWFGSYHSTLKLDIIMLSILGFLFFICIFIALRSKDPLKIR